MVFIDKRFCLEAKNQLLFLALSDADSKAKTKSFGFSELNSTCQLFVAAFFKNIPVKKCPDLAYQMSEVDKVIPSLSGIKDWWTIHRLEPGADESSLGVQKGMLLGVNKRECNTDKLYEQLLQYGLNLEFKVELFTDTERKGSGLLENICFSNSDATNWLEDGAVEAVVYSPQSTMHPAFQRNEDNSVFHSLQETMITLKQVKQHINALIIYRS